MIKVIREGNKNTPIYKEICENCKNWFEYTNNDIHSEIFKCVEITFIKCPVCGDTILLSN